MGVSHLLYTDDIVVFTMKDTMKKLLKNLVRASPFKP